MGVQTEPLNSDSTQEGMERNATVRKSLGTQDGRRIELEMTSGGQGWNRWANVAVRIEEQPTRVHNFDSRKEASSFLDRYYKTLCHQERVRP